MELIKMKNRNKVKGIAFAAIIAAMYVILTYIASAMGIASGAIQVRFSEALTILPIFTPYAIPGLFVGCILANILSGCAVWDIILGSIATLIGALGTYLLKNHKILPFLPPILANTLIIPPVLIFVYNAEGTFLYFLITILAGEVISCGILGYLLKKSLIKRNIQQYFK